ncbi:MAG: hypothetical protein ABIH79_00360 [archaeon]
MKFQKIIFIFSLIGILLIILLAQNTKQTQTGKINSIKYSEDIITIELENFEEKLIIFDTNLINLKNSDRIEFQGRREIYKNEEQIIIDKIQKVMT